MTGQFFNHSAIWSNDHISAINMKCGRKANAMRVRYGCRWSTWSSKVNWTSCADKPDYELAFTLSTNEFITNVDVSTSGYISTIKIVSNHRSFPVCRRLFGSSYSGVDGNKLLYMSGRAGCHFDQLQFYWAA